MHNLFVFALIVFFAALPHTTIWLLEKASVWRKGSR